jgi:GDP-L-fucose synthase
MPRRECGGVLSLNMEHLDARIYVAGHRGLVGSALVRELKSRGYTNLITATHGELDLTHRPDVIQFFGDMRPEYVFLAAAKVGGIKANNEFPVDFLKDNLEIQTNVISQAHDFEVKKLLFTGSSCIYPRMAPQPIVEESLLAGPLEPTNQWYAVAKIAGIKLCQAYRRQYGCNFISVMPTNLYGPGDCYDLDRCHVMPALIRKFHEAKGSVEVWGSGKPRREFLYVDDLARACLLLMEKYDSEEIINVGYGSDVTICELVDKIKRVTRFKGSVHWNESQPDGTPRKLIDSSRMRALGWEPKVTLDQGLPLAYQAFLNE